MRHLLLLTSLLLIHSLILLAAPTASAQDLRVRTTYIAGDQRTESVTYIKGARERFEFRDMVVLQQRDLKRRVQISRAANSYLVVPDAAPPAPANGPANPPGVVAVTTTIVDTGERKPAFGRQARRVKTTIDRQPMPGACDGSKQRIEIDGWYIDLPAGSPPRDVAPPPDDGCTDQIRATQQGDANALGFPIAYSMTIAADEGTPTATSMEVTELDTAALDPALFEIPPGLAQAGDIQALSRAVSDANEAQLARAVTTTPAVPKAPGTIRIGVPELANKTTQQVDTRALRAQLIAHLREAKIDAEPLPAGAEAELLQHAAARAADYVLVAEVTELKVSRPGGFGALMKAASSVAGGARRDPTEATIAMKLVQPDGRARTSTNGKGKDGGFDLKAGLGVAKFAGSMYLNVMTGRMMLGALNGGMAGGLNGLGVLGNPALFNTQAQALRSGIDPTAGAAAFLMQQSMAGQVTGGTVDQVGPSFDAAIDEAMKNAVKAVTANVNRR